MTTPQRVSPRHRGPRIAPALRALVAILVPLVAVVACSSDDPPVACEGPSCHEDPCRGVTCGDDGRCEVAGGLPVCHCARGFDAVALDCVQAGEDLCARAPCSAGCTATATADGPRCQCRDGERSTGLGCVAVSAPACAGVACSGHGRCEEVDGRAACTCDDGYAPTADGLGCARVPPAEACVVANEPRCAPGHGFSVCCRGMSCELRFEDGKVLRGLGAAASYCKGRITSLDGACGGTPVPCETLSGQEQQCAGAACRFEAGTGACVDGGFTRDCNVRLDPAACSEMPGCEWTPSPVDEDLATIEDGTCAGTPEPCETHAGDVSRCRLAGCQPAPPDGCHGDLSNTCAKHGSRGTCEKAPGCYWIAPRASDDWRCGPSTGMCKDGRSHALCCDNACETRFEDGTTMRGTESVVGYCLGATGPGAEDGSCISACWQISDPAACGGAEESCRWTGDRCEGTDVACFGGYDRRSCTSRPACAWIERGGSTTLPGDSKGINDRYVPDTITLPVIASPPVAPGTVCPEECGHGCVIASGKVVLDGNGKPKPLPNMTFCVATGTPILAVAAGEVVSAETTYLGEGDYAVQIRSTDNPNFSFIYDHVSAVTVSVGAVVKPGDPIAVGQASGGASTFELQVNELRGPQPHQTVVDCPSRYATSEVNAAMTALLLAGHLSSRDDWGLASWALCDRPSVQGY